MSRHLLKFSLLQFSGQNAEEMRKCYVEFCSRHLKAVKLYKELLARDKRFQQFIRVRVQPEKVFLFIALNVFNKIYFFTICFTVKRVSRGSLLRRHGVQECILLVTQRITKYPVLIKRILDNTKGETILRHVLKNYSQSLFDHVKQGWPTSVLEGHSLAPTLIKHT